MNRRNFLASAATIATVTTLAAGTQRPRTARAETAAPARLAAMPGWRQFEIVTRVSLLDAPGAAQLWLPLAQTAGGYQTVLETRCQGTGQARVVRDAQYGAEVLKMSWDAGSDGPRSAELVQRVATRDRDGHDPAVPVTLAERRFWTRPTESVQTDGIVRDTAERITAGLDEPRARLRAIYDWVVDHTTRDPETPGCGFGDVRGMLESGRLSGKCADINGLMTGLARAAGFPARDVYGVRVAGSRQFQTLGASGDVSRAQHCRSEVFLEDAGWFPLDPADVRKVMLEQRLAPDSAGIRALRETLFGSWEMNWVGYNSATDIILPGAMGNQKPNFAFLMYPCAFTANGQPDCLDPVHFRYGIEAREIAA